MANRRQGIYWLITWSCQTNPDQPILLPGCMWIKGQQELGAGGFLHWQFIVGLSQKGSIRTIQELFPGCHGELSRSNAAETYVWKEDTYQEGTRFELGVRPVKRNSASDWDSIWDNATKGLFMEIPADIRIRSYVNLRRISADYSKPVAIERSAVAFIGPTGTGKSRLAWEQAGVEAYCKDPRTKFWCGYRGQENVIIDEFRGGIDVAHILRWTDRYPVIVELKGSAAPLNAIKYWFASNVHPNEWYPELDIPTRDALLRRLVITEF